MTGYLLSIIISKNKINTAYAEKNSIDMHDAALTTNQRIMEYQYCQLEIKHISKSLKAIHTEYYILR